MEKVSKLAHKFKKEDFYGYADATPLPFSGDGPYIWNSDDELGTQVILSGSDGSSGATIQVFFIEEDKDHCYGVFRNVTEHSDLFKSEEDLEDTFIQIFNKLIKRLSKGQPVHKTCKLMSFDKLI